MGAMQTGMSDMETDTKAKRPSRRLPPPGEFGKLTKIPYSDGFDAGEMNILREGFRPKTTADKWLSLFSRKTLYLHRSQTGKGIYQLRFKLNKDGSGDVKWAKASKDVIVIDKHYEAALLDFIIAHVLLGHDIQFPRHAKVDQNGPGHFQNAIAGTEQVETEVTTRMIKGQFK